MKKNSAPLSFRFSNLKQISIMNNCKKSLCAAAGLALLPAAGMFAYGDSDLIGSDYAFSGTDSPFSASYASALSVEAFYAWANDKMTSDDIDKVDVGGVSLRYAVTNTSTSIGAGTRIFPEFYGILSFGGGSLDQTWDRYYYNSLFNSVGHVRKECNYDVLTVQAAVGANLRCFVTDNFSVFGGVRLGLAYESLEVELYESGSGTDKEKESDVGFLYGLGVGAEWEIRKRHSLTLGFDYVASTAQPEFDGDIQGKPDKQSYLVLSVGYKYRF